LSDQEEWAEQKELENSNQQIGQLVAKDGKWAKSFLESWLKEKNYNYSLIDFKVSASDKYGIADWEASDYKITSLLKDYISQKNGKLYYQDGTQETEIEKIIIQHSTGTPSLTSALYLWGMEKKLAGYLVEFLYISEEEGYLYEETITHEVNHWQWHLQLPLIRKLLAIKDFSGALELVKDAPFNSSQIELIKDRLINLDKAVSFNLIEKKLKTKEDILERIAIALWSEQSFREVEHWMHWYLRIAGAFELALLFLIEHQRSLLIGQKNNDSYTTYEWETSNFFPKLVFEFELEEARKKKQKINIEKISINDLVQKLLTKGSYQHLHKFEDTNKDKQEKEIELQVSKIIDTEWNDFVNKFYCQNWKIGQGSQLGFCSLRNKLYHNLCGDKLDRDLDAVQASEVVERLKYILKLSGIVEEIDRKIQVYQEQYESLMKDLF
ncbi:hypothetical protein, partial [Hyella patelloides]|uniref:hypothetical protein n=1 Tax=Hyella patelloides TaxID=1982969 RepID=UPI001643AE58